MSLTALFGRTAVALSHLLSALPNQLHDDQKKEITDTIVALRDAGQNLEALIAADVKVALDAGLENFARDVLIRVAGVEARVDALTEKDFAEVEQPETAPGAYIEPVKAIELPDAPGGENHAPSPQDGAGQASDGSAATSGPAEPETAPAASGAAEEPPFIPEPFATMLSEAHPSAWTAEQTEEFDKWFGALPEQTAFRTRDPIEGAAMNAARDGFYARLAAKREANLSASNAELVEQAEANTPLDPLDRDGVGGAGGSLPDAFELGADGEVRTRDTGEWVAPNAAVLRLMFEADPEWRSGFLIDISSLDAETIETVTLDQVVAAGLMATEEAENASAIVVYDNSRAGYVGRILKTLPAAPADEEQAKPPKKAK